MKDRTDTSNELFAVPTSGQRTSGRVEALPSGPRRWPLVGHLPLSHLQHPQSAWELRRSRSLDAARLRAQNAIPAGLVENGDHLG